MRKKTALEDLPKSLKQHVPNMNNVVRHAIVRSLKFQERGWNLYSEEAGTVCEKIMWALDLPVDYSHEHKAMTKTLGRSTRNKI